MATEDDLKSLMRRNYITYASYVILERAIPSVVDGLKPVQRRILHTLEQMDDGRLHKVANVVGQTMAYHPHGDAPINEALVNLANKDYLLDKQGNFGNLFTGDPAAAARYIETRLSPLAKATLFNSDLTHYTPSYDGRKREPLQLPAKIPLLLMHGAEGIAVGMSTRILPHNFAELLEAEIAYLEGREYTLLPDFPTGGVMDAGEYDRGRGKVQLRAKVHIKDDKTLVIEEICYGTTTESLIRSIDEAAKKGKLKIDSIHDYTAEKVEIEVTLPRGQHAREMIDKLYAFTDCQISLNSIPLVIKEELPWETDVHRILEFHTDQLQAYLKRELEIEQERLLEKIFQKTLEQIFIENRLYKKLETVAVADKLDETVAQSLLSYHDQLQRKPEKEDRDRLLQIPIRRISRFDVEKNEAEIGAIRERLEEVGRDLRSVKRVTIRYIKELLKAHGKAFPRRTQIEEIKQLDLRAIKTEQVKVGFDSTTGFLGTKVSGDKEIQCTNFDKLLVLYKNGTYQVINIPEKQYLEESVYVGVADKKTELAAIYRDSATGLAYGKRFVITQFLVDRLYPYLPEGGQLEAVTSWATVTCELEFPPKGRQKQPAVKIVLETLPLKGAKARGVRLASRAPKRIRFHVNNKKEPDQLW
jgi:topoisomerase IV subunit A